MVISTVTAAGADCWGAWAEAFQGCGPIIWVLKPPRQPAVVSLIYSNPQGLDESSITDPS